MDMIRRGYIEATNTGTVADALSRLAFDPMPIRAYASDLEFEGVRELSSICPLCSENCRYIAHVKAGRVVSAEGDPGYRVSQGALCEKGAAMLPLIAVASDV